MKNTVYFDIETVPCQLPGIRGEFIRNVKAPAQYKKPESIAEWVRENAAAEGEAEWLRTSFDGGLGQVCVIGWALNDGPAQSLQVADLGRDQERALLAGFFAELSRIRHAVFVGHNVIGFDLPFLWKRAMVLGVNPGWALPRNPKPWGDLVRDTMLLWDGQQRAGGSMDRICRLLGIPGKDGMSGADVWPAVQAGRIDDVAAYCRGDVERTRAMFKRMTFADAADTGAEPYPDGLDDEPAEPQPAAAPAPRAVALEPEF